MGPVTESDEQPLDEDVALVDLEGAEVGTAPRSVVRRDNLRHGATAVLVRNSAAEIYLHRRSPRKDWAPGHYDAAAGGVLRPGEDPALSAARELAEELGIEGAVLRPLGICHYEDDRSRAVEHCFETTWDGPVNWADGEVVWGRWMALGELDEWWQTPGVEFVPDTRRLLTMLARRGERDYVTLQSLLR